MSADQLATRVLAEQSGISSENLRMGKISKQEFRDLARAAAELESLPLYIDDTPGLTIAALRARARRLKRQKGIGMVIVDYLQLLQGTGRNGNENRVKEISEISRGLKQLAKELDVPVIGLSQLSRAVEQREDKRPQLSDLRESGSIEQDADIVLFIYREDYYSPPPARRRSSRHRGVAAGDGTRVRARRSHRRQAAPRRHRQGPGQVRQPHHQVQRFRRRSLPSRSARLVRFAIHRGDAIRERRRA
jgi:replicative DNA helicase